MKRKTDKSFYFVLIPMLDMVAIGVQYDFNRQSTTYSTRIEHHTDHLSLSYPLFCHDQPTHTSPTITSKHSNA